MQLPYSFDASRVPVARAPLDFPGIARAALPHLETICARWLPGGRRIGQEWTCGSLAGEAGESCKVNLRTGKWCDFASGEKGGDAIALAAAIHNLKPAEAARNLARMLGMEGGR
jgi:putative DNA primase/helicase